MRDEETERVELTKRQLFIIGQWAHVVERMGEPEDFSEEEQVLQSKIETRLALFGIGEDAK